MAQLKFFFRPFSGTPFSSPIICSFLFLCVLLLPGLQARVPAHAHVWITNGIIFYFDKQGLAGFKVEWVFDEMFSNMIIHDYDENRNGALEPAEIKRVEKGAFSNLKEFAYFLHVKIDKKEFKVRFVKDFNAKIVTDRVVYHFLVPCHVKAGPSPKKISIGIYDESFYTQINLLKDQIFFENNDCCDFQHSVELNKDEPYYYGQVYPEEIVLVFKKKND